MNLSLEEKKKRKREIRVAVLIAIVFVISVISQTLLRERDSGYGFFQSLVYFAFLHLNVILIMLLVFLVSRNLIKGYLDRRSGKLGSSLRWKMVTSLVGFSLLPSILLFVGSTSVIRQGFDQWFGGQVAGVLSDAQAVVQLHYEDIESDLNFYSGSLARETAHKSSVNEEWIVSQVQHYPLYALEFYSSTLEPPLKAVGEGVDVNEVPRASLESLSRAFEGENFKLIRRIGFRDLVQQFVPIHMSGRVQVLVLSQSVPLAMKTRMNELESAFASYQQTRKIKNTLKLNYTLILLTLFLLTMFVVSWFGLYVTKQVTDPVADLMKATEAFRVGDWDYRIPLALQATKTQSQAPDLEILKAAFNLMSEEVARRGQKLESANERLMSLVKELEERERYLETLLSSIRRGVVVLDSQRIIQRINKEALGFSTDHYKDNDTGTLLGKSWDEVFYGLCSPEDSKAWFEEMEFKEGRSVDRIFELSRGLGRSLTLSSVRATGIELFEENKKPMGTLIILEDVSDAARMERLAAWQEVARRVAHEIKNPLTPVQLSADRMQRRLERSPETHPDTPLFQECIGQIQKQVRVIRDLVREFSQFAKMPEPNFSKVNLTSLLGDFLEDYRFTHTQCRFEYENRVSGDVWVRADPEHLRRVFVNLADNAIDSMQEAKVESPRFKVSLDELQTGEAGVKISFEDNGPGVASGMHDKIFDPYMTSKAAGLGLGLPIVRRIAMEHRGRVRCEEVPFGLFVLELPRHVVDA
jgi:two-component system nitrogen regulation sensor histidine kinase NtrY